MTLPQDPTFVDPSAAGNPHHHEPPTFTDGLPGEPTAGLPARHVDETSPFEAIAAELSGEVPASTTLDIDLRPGWTATYSLDINHETFGVWRKSAADRSQPDDTNELRLACIVLANTNLGISRNGRLLEVNGEVLTFRSAEFCRLLGVTRTVDAVRTAYGRDAHVVNASRAVLQKAGYGDDAHEAADPTKA